MTAHVEIERDPNDDWARVELFRWQYGVLPSNDDMRELDVSKGLIGMADALMTGMNKPTPSNVASVLRYVSKLVKR